MSMTPDLCMCEVTKNLALHTSADTRLCTKYLNLSEEATLDVKLKTNIGNCSSTSANSFLPFLYQISQVTAFLQTSKDLSFKNRRLVYVHWKIWMFLVLSSVKKIITIITRRKYCLGFSIPYFAKILSEHSVSSGLEKSWTNKFCCNNPYKHGNLFQTSFMDLLAW